MNDIPKNKYEGKVVTVAGDKLTTTTTEGNQHCHTVTADAKVTCNGKESKLGELKAGTNVRLVTHKDDDMTAIAVDSGKPTKEVTAKT